MLRNSTILLQIIFVTIAFVIQLQVTIQKENNTQFPDEHVNLTILPQKETIHLNYGDAINVRCIVSSNTTTKYRIEWSRSENKSLSLRSIQIDGILHIYPASMKDSGFYVCSAISEQTGKVLCETKILIVLYQVKERYVVEMADKFEKLTIDGVVVKRILEEVAKETTLNISCIASDDKLVNVTWRRVNGSLSVNSKIIGNRLQISNIDVNDRGIYVCELFNNTSKSTKVLLYYFLIVQEPEPPSGVIEVITGDKINPEFVTPFDQVGIYCIITKGEPRPIISWSRIGPLPMVADVSPSDDFLRIKDLQEEWYRQQYICKAENSVGTDTQSVTVLVIPPTRPPPEALEMWFYPDVMIFKVVKGGKVRIECKARGDPPPSVAWVDARPIYNFTSNETDDDICDAKRAILEMDNFQYSDPNFFVCVAENSVKRVEKKIRIRIFDDPNFIRSFPVGHNLNFPRGYKESMYWIPKSPSAVTYTPLRDGGIETYAYFSPNESCSLEIVPLAIEKDFEISLEIKPCRNATGVLFLAFSWVKNYFLLLEIVNNTVELTSGGSDNPFPAVTVFHLRSENYFNDGRWHTIRTAKRNESIKPLLLTVDEEFSGIKFRSYNYSDIKSVMNLGGTCRNNMFSLGKKSYVGCMRNLQIHGERYDLSWFFGREMNRNECPF